MWLGYEPHAVGPLVFRVGWFQDSEQLALVKGEVVEVLHRDISGWSFGRQVLPDGALKDGRGLVPFWRVSLWLGKASNS